MTTASGTPVRALTNPVARPPTGMPPSTWFRQSSLALSVAQRALLSVTEGQPGSPHPGEGARLLGLAPNPVGALATALAATEMLRGAAPTNESWSTRLNPREAGQVRDGRGATGATLAEAVAVSISRDTKS